MIYLISSIVIILINVVPAFMPPTWTIISFVYISYNVNLVLLTIIGAFSSSFGRLLLARYSKIIVPFLFAKRTQSNLNYIGGKIEGSNLKMFLVSLGWAISPIASNPLFIGVGFSTSKVKSVLGGFFLGRLFSYFFLAYTSKIIYESLNNIILSGVTSWQKIIVTTFGFFLIFIYLSIDWEQLLSNKNFTFNFRVFKFGKGA